MNLLRTLLALFSRKDVVVFTLLFLVLGAVIGYFVLPQAWAVHWRILAGLTMGFNGVLYVVGPRMIGGSDYDG